MTQVFLRGTTTANHRWRSGRNDAPLAGGTNNWSTQLAHTVRGAAAATLTRTTVAGPTSGLEVNTGADFVTPPLDADVTIAGAITVNLRMAEGSVAANAGAQIVIERVDSQGAYISTILNSEFGTEMGTTEAAQNWAPTPTSTACKKGDRLRIRVAANDVGTMGTGVTITLWYDGPTAAASGDSYVTFTETFGFQTADPTGTQLFLTDTAGQVDPNGATYDSKEVWTSRGAGVVTSVTNTAAGFTAPLHKTKTAGGNFVEWFSRRVDAFTLTGVALVNLRMAASLSASEVAGRCEIAVCDLDGLNPVIWGAVTTNQGLSTTEAAVAFFVSGEAVAVGAGSRLRVRVFLDDGANAMVTGRTVTLWYAGVTGGGTGDAFVTFPQSLTEFVPAASLVIPRRNRALGPLLVR